MNVIWSFTVLSSLVILLFTNVDIVLDTMILGSSNAISLCVRLLAIYSVWLGILKVVEDTKIMYKINRLFEPIITILFGKDISPKCREYVSINITSNMLGMGNASTPSGINAITSMDRGSNIATDDMIMLLILNTASIQILPTTILGIISSEGVDASFIILPILLTSLVTLVVGILLCKICRKFYVKGSI